MFLSAFAFYNDACLVQTKLRFKFPLRHYACPKPSNGVSSERAVYPFQDSLVLVEPASTRLFKILQMVVLPSGEVCVLGKKLKNFILPENSQFEIMLIIAVWCSPCISETTHTKRNHCFTEKLIFIELVTNKEFKPFSEVLLQRRKTSFVNKILY